MVSAAMAALKKAVAHKILSQAATDYIVMSDVKVFIKLSSVKK
jgi:hypothetical protein